MSSSEERLKPEPSNRQSVRQFPPVESDPWEPVHRRTQDRPNRCAMWTAPERSSLPDRAACQRLPRWIRPRTHSVRSRANPKNAPRTAAGSPSSIMATGAVGAYTCKPMKRPTLPPRGPQNADASQGPPWRYGHGAPLVDERAHHLLMTSVSHAETLRHRSTPHGSASALVGRSHSMGCPDHRLRGHA